MCQAQSEKQGKSMTRPVFGDKETIKQIDPYQVLLDNGIKIPRDILPCRFCGGNVYATFDDTWIEGNNFGAGTINWECDQETDDLESADSHTYQYQHEAMEDEAKIVKWIQSQYPTFKNGF